MQILDENNTIQDTDRISESCFYSVLRFKDPKNPDFFFEEISYVVEFTAPTMKLLIGEHVCFVPFHWSVLCSDLEYVQTIPLAEFSGRDFYAFCLNPIDGYTPYYLRVRMLEVFDNATWSCPPVADKDMLVVPIGPHPRDVAKGPTCAIFSPNKLDINRPLSDII